MVFGSLQYMIILVISVVTLVAAVAALVQALRYPREAYVAAGKRTRTFWGAIEGIAVLIAFLTLPPPLGLGDGVLSLFALAAIVAVVLFFVDVLPKLKQHHRPGPGRPHDNRGGW